MVMMNRKRRIHNYVVCKKKVIDITITLMYVMYKDLKSSKRIIQSLTVQILLHFKYWHIKKPTKLKERKQYSTCVVTRLCSKKKKNNKS